MRPPPVSESGPERTSRVVWITGAAGGLGQGLVEAFAARGWRIAAAFHRQTAQRETAQIWPVPVDVTKPDQVRAGLALILQHWGRVDVLVNNAGVVADQLSWRITAADWDRVLAVNLKGAFLCAQAALGPMLEQRDGHIINVASFAARSGPSGQASYAAAKAGLLGLTQSLAKEVGAHNVRVNAVLPGVLPTPMTGALSAGQLRELAAANTLGRLNSIAEVSGFIAVLAELRNVSGQFFQLDSRIARWC